MIFPPLFRFRAEKVTYGIFKQDSAFNNGTHIPCSPFFVHIVPPGFSMQVRERAPISGAQIFAPSLPPFLDAP